MSDDLTIDDTPDEPTPPPRPLVAQVHGGALNRGENRPKSPSPADIRRSSRKKYYSVLPRLERIARNTPTGGRRGKRARAGKSPFRVADQIAAAALLAKYAMDESIPAEDVRRALRKTLDDIRETIGAEQSDQLIRKIAPHWVGL